MMKRGDDISHQQLFRIFDLEGNLTPNLLDELPTCFRNFCFTSINGYYQHLFNHICQNVETDSESNDGDFRRCIEAEIEYLKGSPGEDSRPLGHLTLLWISRYPNHLTPIYDEFLKLRQRGAIGGSSIALVEDVISSFHITCIGNNSPTPVEVTKSTFIPPGPSPQAALKRMGPPTQGGISSVESMKEFDTPVIGTTMDFRFRGCAAQNDAEENVLLAGKYYGKTKENLRSKWLGFRSSLPDAGGNTLGDEMEVWAKRGRMYTCRNLLMKGNVRLSEFVQFCKEYTGDSEEQFLADRHERLTHVTTHPNDESDEASFE